MKIYDSDIRGLLFRNFQMIDEYINDKETIVVNELDVCSGVSRIDVAVINGKFHGYEIKSAQDNLERLSFQIDSYNQVFDTMTIVSCENHIEKVQKIVPSWWSIICVMEINKSLVLNTVRNGSTNQSINLQNIALFLWKSEMIDLLLSFGNITKGYKSKSRYELSKMIIKHVEARIINDYVRDTLKSRSTWKAVRLSPLNDDWRSM